MELPKGHMEDALLIVRSPDLFCRREAIRYELANHRRSSNMTVKDLQSRKPDIMHLQRGLGLVQSKTLRLGHSPGFGSSQPRLFETKRKVECDHVCDRLARSLRSNLPRRKWASVDALDRPTEHLPGRLNRRTSSNERINREFRRGPKVESVPRLRSQTVPHYSAEKAVRNPVIHLPGTLKRPLNGNPKLKSPLIPQSRASPYGKLAKIFFEEFLQKQHISPMPQMKAVRFTEPEYLEEYPKSTKIPVGTIGESTQSGVRNRSSINQLQATLLPSFTITGDAAPESEIADLVKLLTEEIPKVRNTGRLMEEIQNESFDVDNFVAVVCESLGDELGKALESLKPAMVGAFPKNEKQIEFQVIEPEKPLMQDVGATTSFSTESAEFNDASAQVENVLQDVGTQYTSFEDSEDHFVDAETSYSRSLVDVGVGSYEEQLSAEQFSHIEAEMSEQDGATSPPRDDSFLPPPTVDVTTILDERENVLEKIEEVLSRQSSSDNSSHIFNLSQRSLERIPAFTRHVEVQTDGFKRVRSVTRKVQTLQLFSSSSVTESSSSTLFTCRETTESEEVTAMSAISLSEGEYTGYRCSPGEIPQNHPMPKHSSTFNVDPFTRADQTERGELPRLLELEVPERTGAGYGLLTLEGPRNEFSFILTDLT